MALINWAYWRILTAVKRLKRRQVKEDKLKIKKAPGKGGCISFTSDKLDYFSKKITVLYYYVIYESKPEYNILPFQQESRWQQDNKGVAWIISRTSQIRFIVRDRHRIM